MFNRHPSLRPKPGLPGLSRKTRLSPIGKKAEERYELQFNGYHADFLRHRECDGLPNGKHAEGCRLAPHLNFRPGKRRLNEASHVRKRSRGGLFFELVTHSAACHDAFEVMPPAERLTMLPLAHRLAWTSHHKHPDVVPEPPVPEGDCE